MAYGPFNPDLEPTPVGPRFEKYGDRFKVLAVAMNIKEKEGKRAVFLHCAGPRLRDIFDILEDTGDDFETAAKKLMEYFEPRKHLLFNIDQFQQLSQEKEECCDNYATRLREAAVPCEFLGEWWDIEICTVAIDLERKIKVSQATPP